MVQNIGTLTTVEHFSQVFHLTCKRPHTPPLDHDSHVAEGG